jgi:hypothetical protein
MQLVGGLVAAIVAELSIGGVATSHCEAVEALNLSASGGVKNSFSNMRGAVDR